MKKQLVITSVMGLAFTLTACGGGGSGSDNYNGGSSGNQKINQNFYSFDYTAIEGQNALGFKSQKLQVKDNVGVDEESSAVFEDEYILTDKKLYAPNYKYTPTLKTTSLTNWNLQVLPDVQVNFVYDKINLNGKNVYNTILPGYLDYLDYLFGGAGSVDSRLYTLYSKAMMLKNNATAKFTGDAYCLKTKSFQFSKSFLTFDTSSPLTLVSSNNSYDEVIAFLLDSNQHPSFTSTVKSDILSGYRWSTVNTITHDGDNQSGTDFIVEYQFKPYFADQITDQRYFKFDQEQQIKANIAAASNQAEIAELKRELADSQNGCEYYNEAAANQIANFIR